MFRLVDSIAAHSFRSLMGGHLRRLQEGTLEIADGTRSQTFGVPSVEGLAARLEITNTRAYQSIAFGGSIGAAEAYARRWWTADDLTALIRIVARNRDISLNLDGWLTRAALAAHRLRHRFRMNHRKQSRRNIAAHYDLGNDFFSLFLDPTMTYSCAVFPEPDSSLETASRHKLDLICRKLDLGSSDHLLEIGGGWGSLAAHAAETYGCQVTTTTISKQQYEHVKKSLAAAKLSDQVRVVLVDYRDLWRVLNKRFDKVVSIEMIEAVGHNYLDTYCQACDQLTKPGGRMLLQSIVISDDLYDRYSHSVDFIQRYIFPGGFLPSLDDLVRRLELHTEFDLTAVDEITEHYPGTLRAWRTRLIENWTELIGLGYPDTLLRLWEFYFCYSEGGFLERTVGDFQLLLTKRTGQAFTS
ncbi:MAG: SAM-dependent methyltransferase [Acidobacteria bacterium]|nr:SAM-dependent methyltransferase [Acidobacteriota bacterium]